MLFVEFVKESLGLGKKAATKAAKDAVKSTKATAKKQLAKARKYAKIITILVIVVLICNSPVKWLPYEVACLVAFWVYTRYLKWLEKKGHLTRRHSR